MHVITIGKGPISTYIGSGCRRRLWLDSQGSDKDRQKAGGVAKDRRRTGSEYIKAQGREHETERFKELIEAFGVYVRRGDLEEKDGGWSFAHIDLGAQLPDLVPGYFLVEAEFEPPGSFLDTHGLHRIGRAMRLAKNRPDVLHIVKAHDDDRLIDASGRISKRRPGDARPSLLCIDVKLAMEAGPKHFAELAFYEMALAAWLVERQLDDRFVVNAVGSIWAGPHGSLRAAIAGHDGALSFGIKNRLWLDGLKHMPAEAVVGRVVAAMREDLVETLTVADWKTLPTHVDARCAGCDYLGYEFFPKRPEVDGTDELPAATASDKDQGYCLPTTAATDHLSRIPGLTEGAAGVLNAHGIRTVTELAMADPDHPMFDEHQVLNIERHAFIGRARALTDVRSIGLHERAGTTTVLPKFSDIRVSLSVDFDSASGRCFAFGYQMVAAVPSSKDEVAEHLGDMKRKVDPATKPSNVFLIRDPASEGAQLLRFLKEVRERLDDLKNMVEHGYKVHGGEKHSGRKATVQFYVWDSRTLDKFKEKVGEHILTTAKEPPSADDDVSPMAWMFPPEHAIAGVDSPAQSVATVKSVLRLVALALPHSYGQLEVANLYRHLREGANREPEVFGVHYHFGEPLSDAIPSERGHELWARKSPKKDETVEAFEERLIKAISMRNWATLSVARKISHDLKGRLVSKARTVDSVLAKPKRLFDVCDDGELLYQYALLTAAEAASENDALMAMPPSEREARFASVRLSRTLEGAERTAALAAMDIGESPDLWVFEMSERSRDAKIKKGDFGFSLMPEDKLHMAGMQLKQFREDYQGVMPAIDDDRRAATESREFSRRLREELGVVVKGLDRHAGTIALQPSELLKRIVDHRVFDLDFDGVERLGILDPIHADMFTRRRLRPALEVFGVPQVALTNPLVKPGISRIPPGRRKPTARSAPAADLIWNAHDVARQSSDRMLQHADVGKAKWLADKRPLNTEQDGAYRNAIVSRLTLLLGPPGTGKSATAMAIVAGLLQDAAARGRTIRIAITGPTWVAIDNVLAKIPELVGLLGMTSEVTIRRLMSASSIMDDVPQVLREYTAISSKEDELLIGCLDALKEGTRSMVFGGTSSQLAALREIACGEDDDGAQELFDFMLIDEASQMDVAQTIVAYTVLAKGASVMVVGDDKQMPPIHPVPAPAGYDYVVGSIYDFYDKYRLKEDPSRKLFKIRPNVLKVNYRSNAEVVAISALAGYAELSSGNPVMRMRLEQAVPEDRPSELPRALPWTPSMKTMLAPEHPLVALVHSDRLSSQRNPGEARLAASMVAAVRGSLKHLRDAHVLDDVELWEHGIGIVTPHRAQQAAVIDALGELDFSKRAMEAMYASVDTVERFQGQERILMIASFGMGDADQIAGEAEFLYSLNRFNVIVSRAHAKMIVMMSRSLADHLPKDYDSLRGSKLLRRYVDGTILERTDRIDLGPLGSTELLLG